MRKQLIESTAYEVADQLRAVEEAIEATLAEMAELQGRMVRARTTVNAATSLGHEAFEQLAMATMSMVQARGGIMNCHTVLKETAQYIPGLRTLSFKEGHNCLSDKQPTLHIVN